jgi:putative transposase
VPPFHFVALKGQCKNIFISCITFSPLTGLRGKYLHMGSTYSKIYIHIVFAVKYRQALIRPAWKDNLYKYITGIVQDDGSKMLAINGVEDHIHIFIGYVPRSSLSDLVRQIKGGSSKFINENRFCKTKFRWQEGYGAFSYSRSQIGIVARYIDNQEKHHARKSYTEEFVTILKAYDVSFDPLYLPGPPE